MDSVGSRDWRDIASTIYLPETPMRQPRPAAQCAVLSSLYSSVHRTTVYRWSQGPNLITHASRISRCCVSSAARLRCNYDHGEQMARYPLRMPRIRTAPAEFFGDPSRCMIVCVFHSDGELAMWHESIKKGTCPSLKSLTRQLLYRPVVPLDS